MSREESDEDTTLEQVPDWFDARAADDADVHGPDGCDSVDDAQVGDWFDDPNHRSLDPGGITDDAPADRADGIADRSIVPTDEEDGRTADDAAGTEPSDAGRETPTSTARTSGVADEDTSGTTDPGPSPAPERGPDHDEAVGEEADAATDDADDRTSVLIRLVAWLRSVFGVRSRRDD